MLSHTHQAHQTHHPHHRESPLRLEPKVVLAVVRSESCYPGLRALINISLAVGLAICAITAIMGIISIANSYSVFRRGAEASPLFGISMVAASAVVAFLSFTGRQAVFVMFDIADLLVAERSDSVSRG